jgi:hypothetical protein
MFFHPRFVYTPIITSTKRFLAPTNLASACSLVLLPFVSFLMKPCQVEPGLRVSMPKRLRKWFPSHNEKRRWQHPAQ